MAAARSFPHRRLGPGSLQPGASAMPASQPPFPVYVLNHVVEMADLTGEPEPERGWWKIPCASRRAYGCGSNIDEAVQGLALYARLGDGGPHLNSSLAIRMTDGARRRFESELDPDYYRRRRSSDDAELPSDLIARAGVEVAEEQGVTVILLSFTRPAFFYQQPHLLYYLVYDSVGRSLSMFQIQPDPCEGGQIYDSVCTLRPVVPKRTGVDGSDYELLLLGHGGESRRQDLLLLWLGSLSMSSSDDGGTGVPSMLKSMDFPPGLIHQPFKVDVAFSCQGKAFWGDLKQGLLYCDLHTRDFDFVKLPCEYEADVVRLRSGEEFTVPVRNTRTMGCVGDDCIRFVCIDMPSHYTSAVVRMWELALPEDHEQGKGAEWKEVGEGVPAKVLWERPSFKKAGLPKAPFQYPNLTPHGALCFVLVDQSLFPKRDRPLMDHFCIFDMDYKRLLWHGLVSNYPIITDCLIMYPSSNFLQMKQSTCNMSFAEDRPDAGIKAMAVGEDSPAAGQRAMAGGVREVVQRFEAMALGMAGRVL